MKQEHGVAQREETLKERDQAQQQRVLQLQVPKQLCTGLVEGDADLDGVFGASTLQSHVIAHAMSAASSVHRFVWTIDAGKLRSCERQAVSPSFDLPLAGDVVASRLVLLPRPSPTGRSGAAFRKSRGWGSLQLKSEATSGTIAFMLSICDGTGEFERQPRGPVVHDFATYSTCGLPKDCEQWELSKAINSSSQTFSVCLDVFPAAHA